MTCEYIRDFKVYMKRTESECTEFWLLFDTGLTHWQTNLALLVVGNVITQTSQSSQYY